MNFYTYFKNESKKDCKFSNSNAESPLSLSSFRKDLLFFAFHRFIPLTVFQLACFRSVPLDLPVHDYSILYDYFFRKNDDIELYMTEFLLKISLSLSSSVFDILFED